MKPINVGLIGIGTVGPIQISVVADKNVELA
jgi:homoserine dehydrogenase